MVLILFGIYRREYISQAIPVYMQYLEQRQKWEKINTGTYALFYYNGCNPSRYYFIKNKIIYKMLRYGYPYDLDSVFDKKLINKFLTRGSYCTNIKNQNDVMIEARFNEIRQILWQKLWDKSPFRKNNSYFTYKIGYDFQYGYPRVVITDRENNKDKHTLHITYPHAIFVVSELVMLSKGEKFTNQVLEDILKKYKASYFKRRQSDIVENAKMINEVGGEMIKSAILR